MSKTAIERRAEDLDTVDHCLARAREALDDERPLDAIEELGGAISFAGRSAARETPAATVLVERHGDHQDRWASIDPGETEEIEIHGKATIHIQGADADGGGR